MQRRLQKEGESQGLEARGMENVVTKSLSTKAKGGVWAGVRQIHFGGGKKRIEKLSLRVQNSFGDAI